MIGDKALFAHWLKSRTQTHLDLAMNTGRRYRTEIVERPGLWKSDAELAKLTGDLRSVAASTAGDLQYGILGGDPRALRNSVVTLVRRREDDRAVAFNVLAIMEVEANRRRTTVLHLGLVMVDPGERGKGMSWILYGLTCFLLFWRNGLRPIWISSVTQVPAVVGMVGETFSDVFPKPGGSTAPRFGHRLLARGIMRAHRRVFGVGDDAAFDEERFVIADAYTGGSDALKKRFEDAAAHRNLAYGEWCRRNLDYDRGDDVLQIGRMDFAAAAGFLRNQVPAKSILSVILGGVAALLGHVVLPVAHWFDVNRQWGILRPRTT